MRGICGSMKYFPKKHPSLKLFYFLCKSYASRLSWQEGEACNTNNQLNILNLVI